MRLCDQLYQYLHDTSVSSFRNGLSYRTDLWLLYCFSSLPQTPGPHPHQIILIFVLIFNIIAWGAFSEFPFRYGFSFFTIHIFFFGFRFFSCLNLAIFDRSLQSATGLAMSIHFFHCFSFNLLLTLLHQKYKVCSTRFITLSSLPLPSHHHYLHCIIRSLLRIDLMQSLPLLLVIISLFLSFLCISSLYC